MVAINFSNIGRTTRTIYNQTAPIVKRVYHATAQGVGDATKAIGRKINTKDIMQYLSKKYEVVAEWCKGALKYIKENGTKLWDKAKELFDSAVKYIKEHLPKKADAAAEAAAPKA